MRKYDAVYLSEGRRWSPFRSRRWNETFWRWCDVIPNKVALEQTKWERSNALWRAWHFDETALLAQIAKVERVSEDAVWRQIRWGASTDFLSPVERYFLDAGKLDLYELHRMTRRRFSGDERCKDLTLASGDSSASSR